MCQQGGQRRYSLQQLVGMKIGQLSEAKFRWIRDRVGRGQAQPRIEVRRHLGEVIAIDSPYLGLLR